MHLFKNLNYIPFIYVEIYYYLRGRIIYNRFAIFFSFSFYSTDTII